MVKVHYGEILWRDTTNNRFRQRLFNWIVPQSSSKK